MARPLKLKYNGSDFDGIKEMSDEEIDTVADLILDEFADNSGIGYLTVNGTGTSVGTFIDTRRQDAEGSHPVGTSVNSDTYAFKQDYGSQSLSPSARPLKLYDTSDIKEMDDTEITANIIDRVKTKLASFSIGTYKLQPSAPTPGSWTNVATIYNKHQSHTNDQTILWRRTDEPTSTTVRPLKLHNTSDIKEMDDEEIKELCNHFRKEIVDSGVGKYQLSTSTPSGGTWVLAGSGFSDTRHQIGNVTYTGYSSQVYSGGYVRYYSGIIHSGETPWHHFAGSYAGAEGHMSGDDVYTGTSYSGYTSHYTVGYVGNYTGYYSQGYVGATILSSEETVSTLKLWLRTA